MKTLVVVQFNVCECVHVVVAGTIIKERCGLQLCSSYQLLIATNMGPL